MLKNGSASIDSIRRGDLILVLVIALTALLVLMFCRLTGRQGSRILVTVDGREYGTWSLLEDKTLSIDENGFHNKIEIRDGKAQMTEADCRDKICVHHKPVSRKGETIVCLPHKLVVTVEGEGGEDSSSQIDAISR